MSTGTKLKAYAPAIAIGLILIGFVAVQFRVPSPAKPPAPSADTQATKAPAPEALSPPVPSAASAPSVDKALATGELAKVPAATTWPTYHGGTDLSGYSDRALPDKPDVLWRFYAEGAIRQAPVGDESRIYLVTTSGNVVALDHQGKELWVRALKRPGTGGDAERPERIEAPIACFQSTVYVGSTVGLLHALDASTGATRWVYDVGGDLLGTANFYAPSDAAESPRLYVIERGEGKLHCINPANGERFWRTDPVARCDGSAALSNGMIVYGSCASALHLHTAVEGRLLFTIPMCADCQIASGPAFVGDEVYSGDHSGRFFRADARTGKVVWINEDSKKEIFTTAALGGELVVFGSEDGGVYALERATGKQRWRHDTGKSPTSPVIAADKVVVGVDGVLQFLRLDTGEALWSTEISDAISGPALINGTVIVGSEDGSVIALGAAGA